MVPAAAGEARRRSAGHDSPQIPDSPAGFLQSWRPYFRLSDALKAFSIAFVASKIAYCLDNDTPVLKRPPSPWVGCLHDLILSALVFH
jgi:hypothetical protein